MNERMNCDICSFARRYCTTACSSPSTRLFMVRRINNEIARACQLGIDSPETFSPYRLPAEYGPPQKFCGVMCVDLPFTIYHLSFVVAGFVSSAMTNDKRSMNNGKSLPSKFSSHRLPTAHFANFSTSMPSNRQYFTGAHR